jgi:DNA-binding response OmpR family regulator
MPTTHYLFIIDNPPYDPSLSHYFSQFGFKIICGNTLKKEELIKKKPTVLLINWQTMSNAAAELTKITSYFEGPIIVISNESNATMGIQLLESGADDFLVKPLNPRELHARITAIERRTPKKSHPLHQTKEMILFSKWRVYPASRQLLNEKQEEVILSTTEYNLLLAFLRQPQQILDRNFLLQLTKSSNQTPYDRRIDIQISRLRQKIEADSKKPTLIKTVRNGGYIFTATITSASF